MNVITRIKNYVATVASALWPIGYRYDVLPPQEMRAAMALPWVRETMIQFSKQEYMRNPYYTSVINKIAEQTIGPCPTIIASGDITDENDMLEDSHLHWTQQNQIGKGLREFRKQAALTGVAFALRYKRNDTKYPVKTGYKIYGADVLVNPPDAQPEDRIIDGIEYNENWEPVKFYFNNEDAYNNQPQEYGLDEIIYWSRGYETGRLFPIPECVAGFTVYPFVRRFLQSEIEGAEFRSSFPMALELDKDIYRNSENMKIDGLQKFQYKPRTVPTLPLGTTLKGLPSGNTGANSEKIIRLMAAACALCVEMPANLALGDSSNSNMASAQVDIQPWKNHVNIDRFDMIPVLYRMFNDWYVRAKLVRGLTPPSSRTEYAEWYPHSYVYDPLFQHPDPQKNANSRMTDLISGTLTLNRAYAELGQNARRSLEREAKLIGIPYEKLMQHYLASRTNVSIQIMSGENEEVSDSSP